MQGLHATLLKRLLERLSMIEHAVLGKYREQFYAELWAAVCFRIDVIFMTLFLIVTTVVFLVYTVPW